jgi:hypothetical protein
MTEGEPVDILGNIEKALNSPKVDARMLHQFLFIRDRMTNFDPEKVKVPFLARVKGDETDLKWVMSRIGPIFAMLPPYSEIPGIVENPDVISLEASTSFPDLSPSESI